MRNVAIGASKSRKCHVDLPEKICRAARSGKYHSVGSCEDHAAG